MQQQSESHALPAIAITAQAWACIIMSDDGSEWGCMDDPVALTRELRAMGCIVQRIGNVVRIVRRP